MTYVSIKVAQSCTISSARKCAVQSFEERILGLGNILFIHTTNERYWKWQHGMFVRYDYESVQLIMCTIHSPANLKTLFRWSSHHAQQCRCHCCCFLCWCSLSRVLHIANSFSTDTELHITSQKKLVVVKLGLSERHGMGWSFPIHWHGKWVHSIAYLWHVKYWNGK